MSQTENPGVFALKSKGSGDLGLFALGLQKTEVAPFMVLFLKFKKSYQWIIEHPEKVDEAIIERFFSTVVDPMDVVWEKMELDTRQTLIRRKAV